MKTILTFCLVFVAVNLFGKNTTYDNLVAVNKCWAAHSLDLQLPDVKERLSDRGWIRLHLSLVEQALRQANVSQLTTVQKNNRTKALDYLNQYWHQGNFPMNDKYAVRTPIFIDEYNNFCAVGYLVKATGHEAISRMIASKTNLAYVKEMNYPELKDWAKEYGFSLEELAWIQPGYGPYPGCGTSAVGKGTNGVVNALFVSGDTLFVGGAFTSVDDSINAGGISYLLPETNGYSWHALGLGFDGVVNDIVSFEGKIYAGGSFTTADGNPATSIAFWDGTTWQSAGCLYGAVYDLQVYENELYAAGDFDVCAAMSEVNIAKLGENNVWSQMPPVEGHVNAMEVFEGALYLGGNFNWLNEHVNVLKYTNANGYQTFTTSIKNEVTDFGVYHDTLYAVCKRTASGDSNLVQRLAGNNWIGLTPLKMGYLAQAEGNSFNVFCVHEDHALVGGRIKAHDMMGAILQNCINLFNVPESGLGGGGSAQGNWFMVDSTINKMVVYNNELFAGGSFKTGANYPIGEADETLNGIARKTPFEPVGIPGIVNKLKNVKIYPNPVNAGAVLSIKATNEMDLVELKSIEGRTIKTFKVNPNTNQITLPNMAAGPYMLMMTDKEGQRAGKILVVE